MRGKILAKAFFSMRKRVLAFSTNSFLIVLVALVVLCIVPAHSYASMFRLPATQMANVTSFFPDINYTEPETVEIGFSDAHKLAYFQFDVHALPPSTPIVTASFSAYLKESNGVPYIGIQVFSVQRTWCEHEITWSNKPPLVDMPAIASVSASPGWVTWDVTELMRSWISQPDKNFGFALGTDSASFDRNFDGMHQQNAPYLTIITANDVDEKVLTALAEQAMSTTSAIQVQCQSGIVDGSEAKYQQILAQSKRFLPMFAFVSGIIAVLLFIILFRFIAFIDGKREQKK